MAEALATAIQEISKNRDNIYGARVKVTVFTDSNERF
jgi:hypothetical protein